MKPLQILLCGGDVVALKQAAQGLVADGVMVELSTQLIDDLCFSRQKWDFLLIDLDGMTSFLRSLLPVVCKKFPNLPIVGFSSRTGSPLATIGYGLELDDYVPHSPRAEDLIVRFPHIAAKYLCDTGCLGALGTQPLSH